MLIESNEIIDVEARWKPGAQQHRASSQPRRLPVGRTVLPPTRPRAGRLPWTPPCSFTPPAGFGCLSFLCRMRMEARGAPVNENTETEHPVAWSPESGKTNRRTCQNALTTPSRAALRAKGKRTTRRQAGAGRELSDGAVRRSVRGAASESEAGAQAGPDVLRAEGRDRAAGAEAPGDARGAGRGTPAGPGRASQGASRGSPPPSRAAKPAPRTQRRCSFHSQKVRRVAVIGSIFLAEQLGCPCLEKTGVVQEAKKEIPARAPLRKHKSAAFALIEFSSLGRNDFRSLVTAFGRHFRDAREAEKIRAPFTPLFVTLMF